VAYTGDVTVGGPPDAREITGLKVTKLAVGSMNNNAYLPRMHPDRRTGADRRGQRGTAAA